MNSEMDEGSIAHTHKRNRQTQSLWSLDCVCEQIFSFSPRSGISPHPSLSIDQCAQGSPWRPGSSRHGDGQATPPGPHALSCYIEAWPHTCHKVTGSPLSPVPLEWPNIWHSLCLLISSVPQIAPYFRFITEKRSPFFKGQPFKSRRINGTVSVGVVTLAVCMREYVCLLSVWC